VDSSHMDNVSYQWLGEYHGKVQRAVINDGAWSPLWPTSVTRVGAVITATFNVPEPPIVFDTTIVPAAFANYGFEFSQVGGGGETISSVVITDATNGVVTVTLSGTPTGTSQRLRYAYSKLDSVTLTPRGNLRDSDAAASLRGYTLYNWCVHFDEAVV